MIMQATLLCVGLLLLWFAGELVVRYALQCAYLAGVSTLFIGFFFISLSTGLPELFVVFNATLQGSPGLSVGDIFGSNFFDLAMGLGVPTLLIAPILVHKDEYAKTIYMLISSLLLMLFIFAHNSMTHWHGVLLIVAYAAINLFFFKLRGQNNMDQDNLEHVKKSLARERFLTTLSGTSIKLFSSIMLILIAARITVVHAIALAGGLGLSMTHFGATFIALGTSLPELTLSLTAVRNRNYALALGNSFGSIWDQGGLMMGLLALINKEPIALTPLSLLIPFVLTAYAIVAYNIIQKRSISRFAGALLVSTYMLFILYELIQQPFLR